jgi:hypothetical protein
VISACQSVRYLTISSWLRLMKFHHITICSPSGTPPRSSTRARLSWPARSSITSTPGVRQPSLFVWITVPFSVTVPVSTRTPYSNAASAASRSTRPASIEISAPSSGE